LSHLSSLEIEIGSVQQSFSKHLRVGHWLNWFVEPGAGTLKGGHFEVDSLGFDQSGGRDDTVGAYFSTAKCYKVVSRTVLV
jgi:hypothetical protein